MALLRWLCSWFLISKRSIQVHQKDTLDLAIHPSCLKALNDGGCLRLNQVLSREFKVKSPPLTSSTPPSLARAWGECFHWPMGLKHYKNLTWQTKGRHDQCTDSPRAGLTEGTTLLKHPQGLSLTMRPTRTASPLCFFSPQWPETWLSSAFCVNILVHFEVCFQKFG